MSSQLCIALIFLALLVGLGLGVLFGRWWSHNKYLRGYVALVKLFTKGGIKGK